MTICSKLILRISRPRLEIIIFFQEALVFSRKYFKVMIWALGMIIATVLVIAFRSSQQTKQGNFMYLHIF